MKFAGRSSASLSIYESNQCFVQTKGRSITTDVRANVTFEVILEQCVT